MGGISVLIMMGLLSSILIFFLVLFIIIIFYLVLSYIFESIALFNMLKNFNSSNKYLAFIPIIKKYSLGTLANKNTLGTILCVIDFLKWLSLILFMFIVPSNLVTPTFLIFIVCFIINSVINIYLSFQLLKNIVPKFKDVITVINSITLGIFNPFILFLIRDKYKGE